MMSQKLSRDELDQHKDGWSKKLNVMSGQRAKVSKAS